MSFPINIEQWRLIDGYNNYEISSHGRVRNNCTNRILKTQIQFGYEIVRLTKDKKRNEIRVHRLVGFAFLHKENNQTQIDHIDQNRLNNMLNNLRWSTPSINCRNKSVGIINLSGHLGVNFDESRNRWVATWRDENMKHQQKRFPIKKFGEEAEQLAINYRREMGLQNGYINC